MRSLGAGSELRRFTVKGAELYAAAFSPDFGTVMTAGNDGIVRLWNTQTGQVVRSFQAHQGPIRYAAFSPDGRYLVTAGEELQGVARLWSIK